MDIETFDKHINSDTVSNLFFEICEERYPNADKVLQLTSKLVDSWAQDDLEKTHIKISVLGGIRNMIKDVSPLRLFRSFQHRDDVFNAVIEALEQLEDKLEELEEDLEEEMEE